MEVWWVPVQFNEGTPLNTERISCVDEQCSSMFTFQWAIHKEKLLWINFALVHFISVDTLMLDKLCCGEMADWLTFGLPARQTLTSLLTEDKGSVIWNVGVCLIHHQFDLVLTQAAPWLPLYLILHLAVKEKRALKKNKMLKELLRWGEHRCEVMTSALCSCIQWAKKYRWLVNCFL